MNVTTAILTTIGVMMVCLPIAFVCAVLEMKWNVLLADSDRERNRGNQQGEPCDNGARPELTKPSAGVQFEFGVCPEFRSGDLILGVDAQLPVGYSMVGVIARRKDDRTETAFNDGADTHSNN